MSVKGEKYASAAAKKKHEGSEGAVERKKEYGSAKKGMGFAAAQKQVAGKKNPKTGKPYGKKIAGAILATAARKASPSAKKANPNLRKVKGK